MPEVKNNFLKSKMNKDLDARVIPAGEYRDAQNINVSRSEGDDVGSLENVLGNVMVSDFGLSDECGLEVIGKYMDVDSNRVFAMLTNYTDTSADKLSNHASLVQYDVNGPFVGTGTDYIKCYICVYDITNDNGSVIVEGTFLNFSKTHQIYGIDLIEDQLFWTDNRNQPRKINVTTAINNPNYYFAEEHISVAKFAPFLAPQLFRELPIVGRVSMMRDTVREFLPDGVTPNPQEVPNWEGDPDHLEEKFVRFSYRLKFDDNEYSLIAPFSQTAFIPQEDGFFIRRDDDGDGDIDKDNISPTYRSTDVKFMRNKVTEIELLIPPISNGITDPANPFKLVGWRNIIDDFKVKQVEILYKESNTNAVKVVAVIDAIDIIPQVADRFVDGFGNLRYVYRSEKPIKTLPNSQVVRVSDTTPVKALAQSVSGNRVIYGNFQDKHSYPESINYRVGVVDKSFDEAIEYPNHTLKQNRSYEVGIVLSDIYGRQSGVITTTQEGLSTLFHKFKQHPFSEASTAPSDGIKRWVGDILSMEFYEKIPENSTIPNYPGLHSFYNPLGWFSYKIVVKQKEQEYYNAYIPGILNGYVFEDKTPPNTPPYPIIDVPATEINPTCHFVIHSDNINKIPRDLLEVGPEQTLFRTGLKKIEPSQDEFVQNLFSAGIFGGGQIIQEIQQRNQEIRDLQIENLQRDTIENSSMVLYGRVTNYDYLGAEASAVTVPGLRNSRQYYPTSDNNFPYDPINFTKRDEVTTIAKLSDLGLYTSGSGLGASSGWALDGLESDPLIAKVIVEDPVGDTIMGATGTFSGGNMLPTISVYETQAFESQIDIYWETTTTGLISELNSDIEANTTEIVNEFRMEDGTIFPPPVEWNILNFNSNLSENYDPIASGPISVFSNGSDWKIGAQNDTSVPYGPAPSLTDISTYTPGSMALLEARDGAGNIVTSKFQMSVGATDGATYSYYRLELVDYLTFSSNPQENEFYFTIQVTEEVSQIISSLTIGPMTILNGKPQFVTPFPASGTGSTSGGSITWALTFPKAVNGSADPVNNTNELSFLINSQTDNIGNPVNYFYLTPSGVNGTINMANNPGTPAGSYDVDFVVIDGGNSFAISSTVTINIS